MYASGSVQVWHLQCVWRQVKGATCLQRFHAPVPWPLAKRICPAEGNIITFQHPSSTTAYSSTIVIRAGVAFTGEQGASLARLPLLPLQAWGSAQTVPAGPSTVPATAGTPRGMRGASHARLQSEQQEHVQCCQIRSFKVIFFTQNLVELILQSETFACLLSQRILLLSHQIIFQPAEGWFVLPFKNLWKVRQAVWRRRGEAGSGEKVNL